MKKRKRNLCVLLLSILVAAAWSAVVLNVSAYFSHQNEKNNVLKTGDNTSHIEEEFEPPDQVTTDTVYPKKVTVKNDSHTPCYVRVFVELDQPNLPVSIDFKLKTGQKSRRTDTITIAASLAEGKRRSLCLPM